VRASEEAASATEAAAASVRAAGGPTTAEAIGEAPAAAGEAGAAADDAAPDDGANGNSGDKTTETVQSAWEKAVAARPTLILPAAAIATVLCAYMHLFLFHSIAAPSKSGLPDTKLAFAVDALLTGLALAGGAKPFHDLTETIAAKSTSNKQEAAAKATGTAPAT
jgi:hypothetical protein